MLETPLAMFPDAFTSMTAYIVVTVFIGGYAYAMTMSGKAAGFWILVVSSYLGYETNNGLLSILFWIGLLGVIYIVSRIVAQEFLEGDAV